MLADIKEPHLDLFGVAQQAFIRLYYNRNLNWAAQNLRHGGMRLYIAGVSQTTQQ